MKNSFKRFIGGGYSLKRKRSALRKGFTLIELLVVIAVIGLLAAVILASLNSARDKGKIASIKSNLKNLGSQAEIYFNDHGTYAGLCSPDNSDIDPSIQPFIDEIKNIAGQTSVKCFVQTPGVSKYYADDMMENRNFAVAVAFNDIHYAVDTTGVVTFDTVNTGGLVTWANAQIACANAGKRQASIEELKAVWNIYSTSGAGGFTPSLYWSSSISPAMPNAAYILRFDSGGLDRHTINTRNVRCVS